MATILNFPKKGRGTPPGILPLAKQLAQNPIVSLRVKKNVRRIFSSLSTSVEVNFA